MTSLAQSFQSLQSLQYLRGFCAIAIVLYHIEGTVNDSWPVDNSLALFHWGHLGVPVFFCLSGFIISYSAYIRPKRSLEFLYSRLARIYPAYIVTAALFVLALLVSPSGSLNMSSKISFNELFNTLFFNFGFPGGYVYVGWSLFYEMAFYFFFSFLVFRFHRVAKSNLFYWLISLLLVFFSFASLDRICIFIVGICVFLLIYQPIDNSHFSTFVPLVASLIFSACTYLPGLLCASLLFFLIRLERIFASAFSSNLFLLLGDSSYSIYLIQVLSISGSIKCVLWFSRYFPQSFSYFSFYLLSSSFSLIATLILGVLMRKYVEKPIYASLMRFS